MKKLLSSKWRNIPVGIMVGVLAFCLLTGGAFAAYTFWGPGSANVTVSESMAVSNLGGDNGDYDGGGVWAVGMYPGESKVLYVRLTNSASVAQNVNLNATPPGGITANWYESDGVTLTTYPEVVAASSSADYILKVTAAGDATPGGYNIPISFSRQ